MIRGQLTIDRNRAEYFGESLNIDNVQNSPRLWRMHSDQLLREHGVQVTAQRIAVMNAITDHKHISADAVATAVRADIGSISRQSVYDTLALLVSEGLVRKIQPVGSPALFERELDDNHHHIICRDCGHLADVECAVGNAPCLSASDDHGFEIDEAEVAYLGRCPTCQKVSRN